MEAQWIAAQCLQLPLRELSPLLNIGSSDLKFRTQTQPWIQDELFSPIEGMGVKVFHCDLKAQDGVDLVGDFFDEDVFRTIKATRARSLICSNILEHVLDPNAFIRRCLDLVESGGIIIVTVPFDYPYHADPIDTMFRPSPEEVLALFGEGITVIKAGIYPFSSYREVVGRRPWLLLRPLLRLPIPFIDWNRWKRTMKKLYYLFNDYKQTCVVVRKG